MTDPSSSRVIVVLVHVVVVHVQEETYVASWHLAKCTWTVVVLVSSWYLAISVRRGTWQSRVDELEVLRGRGINVATVVSTYPD